MNYIVILFLVVIAFFIAFPGYYWQRKRIDYIVEMAEDEEQ